VLATRVECKRLMTAAKKSGMTVLTGALIILQLLSSLWG
jgi:hypothetical protein